jgi:drug/metabolite transporter (DMT)-like permease
VDRVENKTKGIILVLITAIVSGVSIFLNSFAVKGFDSSVFTFSKNMLVAVFLLAIILGIGQLSALRQLTSKQWMKLTTIGLIGGSIPFLLFFKGLQMTTATSSGFIHKMLFIFATVMAVIFLKEKINKWLIIGISLLTAGTFALVKPQLSFSLGEGLILAAVIMWAAENTISKQILKDLSGTVVAFGRMFFGAMFIFIFLLFTGKAGKIATMTLDQYVWIALTTVLLLLYVMTFYNGLKHVKLSTAAAMLSLGMPITIALDFAFRGAAVTAYQAIGAMLIVAGTASITFLAEKASNTAKAGTPNEWN